MVARKYAHQHVYPLAALMFYRGPSMIDNLLRTSLHYSYKLEMVIYGSCFTCDALVDANM